MAITLQEKTPHQIIRDVCRLCDVTFTDKRDKHNLIIGAREVKPAYTLALEELTGPVNTTDDLIAVCGACRNLLNRYHRCSCEVKRIGALVRSMSLAHSAARCAEPTPTDDDPVRKRIKIEHEDLAIGSVDFSQAANNQTAINSPAETSSSRLQPKSQLHPQSQHAPQLTSHEGEMRGKPIALFPVVLSAYSIQSAVCSLKPGPQPQPQSQHAPQLTALPSDDGAVRKKFVPIAPALQPQPVQAAVETSSSRPQPQSQHAPQSTVQASNEGEVERKPVAMVPVVWSAHSIQSAVCSLKPGPQPQPKLQSQHAPQPTVQTPSEGEVERKPVTMVPVLWSAHSVQSAVCSLKSGPQPQSQLQSEHPPPPTALQPDDGAMKKKLLPIAPALQPQSAQQASTIQEWVSRVKVEAQPQTLTTGITIAAPALCSQPLQNQKDGSHTVTDRGQSTPSLCIALTQVKSLGHDASSLSEGTKAPVRKQSKIVIRTAHSLRSRIVRGPMEKVLEKIVQGRLNRIPHAIMSVPGLFDVVVQEVANVVKNECKKLTSLKFTSILRQTSIKDLKDFKWMDVVEEWRINAPTYLKFLESASSCSMEAPTKRIRPAPHSKTNKYKLSMAGAILLNARCESMSAHMYRNAMVMCHCGTKRCFQWLNRLGVCISDGRALAKLKEIGQTEESNFLQWKENISQEYRASDADSGVAEIEFTLLDTASDECQDDMENKMAWL